LLYITLRNNFTVAAKLLLHMKLRWHNRSFHY